VQSSQYRVVVERGPPGKRIKKHQTLHRVSASESKQVSLLIWQCKKTLIFPGKSRILTLILLTWRIWWAPNNASKWQMGFNSPFKVLKPQIMVFFQFLFCEPTKCSNFFGEWSKQLLATLCRNTKQKPASEPISTSSSYVIENLLRCDDL